MDVEFLRWDDPRWAEAGLTYRRIDYWTKIGYLRTLDGNPHPGSGFTRRWPISEYCIARRIDRLTEAGFVLSVAADLARYPDQLAGVIDLLAEELGSRV